MKDSIIINKIFPPLDDLYILLDKMQKILRMEIADENYIAGRKQLYYIFMHETMHAFVAKSANWIYDLSEDETDFIDEVVVRILIDDLINELNIFSKLDLYYENHINHRKEIEYYGFNLEPEQYDHIEKYYKKEFSKMKKNNDFCHYVHHEYKRLAIKRKNGFSYKMNE